MTIDPGAAFEARASRAEALEALATSATETLSFVAEVYRVQGVAARRYSLGALEPSISAGLRAIIAISRDLLAHVGDHGPAALRAQARLWASERDAALGARLVAFWRDEHAHEDHYLARAVLRPYVEALAAAGVAPDRDRSTGCPFCGSPPWIGARRGAEAAEAVQRFLGCGLCGREWPSARVGCSFCGEADPAKLPTFQAEGHPAARIEACDACRAYVKSVDLTVEPRAIPEVDDLTSLSLDLWARDQGYARPEPGLAGL